MSSRRRRKADRNKPLLVIVPSPDRPRTVINFTPEERQKILRNFLCGSCGTTTIVELPCPDCPAGLMLYAGHEERCPVALGAVDPMPNYLRALAS